MTFSFDTTAVLARIRERAAAIPAIPAIPASASVPPASTLAEIATLAGGCGQFAHFAAPASAPDLDRYEELAATLEYDQGLPRAEAEIPAAQAQGHRDGAALLATYEASVRWTAGHSGHGKLATTRPPAPARHGVLPGERS
jgi:hypothetical protein